MAGFFDPPQQALRDFFNETPPLVRASLSRGGARPNTGPKPKTPKVPEAPSPEEAITNPSAYQRYERARADKEEHLARQAAVKADLEEGSVVRRDAVATAASRAFATCSQSLDAIGDTLERDGIPLDVCEKVMVLVNQAKQQLANDLEKTHAESND